MSKKDKRIRVLLTKSRLDGHDRGVRYLAKKLMEGGMEVIFTRFALPEEIVRTAMAEDVDVIGISFSVGRPPIIASEVMQQLRENNLDNILVILGGIIPDDDIPQLLEMGVGKTFGPGSPADDVIQYITSRVKQY